MPIYLFYNLFVGVKCLYIAYGWTNACCGYISWCTYELYNHQYWVINSLQFLWDVFFICLNKKIYKKNHVCLEFNDLYILSIYTIENMVRSIKYARTVVTKLIRVNLHFGRSFMFCMTWCATSEEILHQCIVKVVMYKVFSYRF